MSTISGILHRDGSVVGTPEARRLALLLSHRIADRDASWNEGPIGMSAGLLRTTPEAAGEQQPYVDDRRAVAVVFDGRLDNRDDLVTALSVDGAIDTAVADVVLVAAAYRRWADDCAARFVGDFAFALWDRAASRLFCARDILGMRPFFYRADGSRLLWASEAHALLRVDGTTPRANEAMAAEYLTRMVSNDETLLAGILRLPPAHVLIAERGGTRVQRYWDVDPHLTIRYRDPREYVDHLQSLTTTVVRAQTRSTGPIGILLSGGVDSSTVAAVARRVADVPVRAYSLAVDGPEDESVEFRGVAAHVGIDATVMTADFDTSLLPAAEVDRYLDIPQYPNAQAAMPLRARAQRDGVRVMLTGLGPDEWLRGSQHHYADQLRRGHLVALARGVAADSRIGDFVGWRRAARMALWPLVPAALQQPIARLWRGQPYPRWIADDFARRTQLGDRLRRRVRDPGFPTHAQYDMYRVGFHAWDTHAFELLDRSGAPFGIEHRHPFNDRRIIEFGFALPESIRWPPGQPKHLLREVAASYVPRRAARRLTSPDYSRMLVAALRAHDASGRFRALAIADAGWVDGAQLRRLYDTLEAQFDRGDPAYVAQLWPLWNAFAIDLWYRSAIAPAAAAATVQ